MMIEEFDVYSAVLSYNGAVRFEADAKHKASRPSFSSSIVFLLPQGTTSSKGKDCGGPLEGSAEEQYGGEWVLAQMHYDMQRCLRSLSCRIQSMEGVGVGRGLFVLTTWQGAAAPVLLPMPCALLGHR